MGLLVILLVAILDFIIGSLIPPKDEYKAKGFIGYNGKYYDFSCKVQYNQQ